MWNNQQRKDLIKRTQRAWGAGWDLLSEHQQEAEISKEIIDDLIRQLPGGVVSIVELQDKIRATMHQAGLWDAPGFTTNKP